MMSDDQKQVLRDIERFIDEGGNPTYLLDVIAETIGKDKTPAWQEAARLVDITYLQICMIMADDLGIIVTRGGQDGKDN